MLRVFRIVQAVLVCMFLAVGASAVFGQGTADIVGTVTDNTGAVVANAQVTFKNVDTNLSRAQATTATGEYSFTFLPIGTYSVKVEAQGFKTFTADHIVLATGDRTRVDAKLSVGEATQTIQVTAQSGGLQTDTSTVGGLISSQAVQSLPVNGRNFIQLVQLAPGATPSIQGAIGNGSRPDDRRQTSSVAVNGLSDQANNFLLDGMDDNERAIATIIVKPSIDAEQDVKVDTSAYPAEEGRAGGAVINVITKSGTNNFHGSIFEFLRNDITDSKDYFNVPQAGNSLAGVRPEYRQNQFGGSIGGPIRKDKTFFFADYEGFRKIKGNTFTAPIPSACELGRAECNGITQLGNFSDISTPIYDPVSHARYTNNVIPSAAINSVAANYAALIPSLSCSTPPCTFVSSPKATQYANTADARIDQRFGDKDNFFGRYSINNTNTYSPGFLPAATVAGITVPEPSPQNTPGVANPYFPGPAYQRQQSLAISDVHIFSPNLLLQLNAQATRYVTLSSSANAGIEGNTAFGGPANVNVPGVRGTSGLAMINFLNGGYADLGDGYALPTDYWDTNYQYAGAVTWTKGTHTFKFGSSLLRRDWSTFQVLYKGQFNISSAQTSSTGSSSGTGGNSFASFLDGYYGTFVRNMGLVAPQYRAWEIGNYAQDDWRAKHWLTINAGLRWDVFTPITSKHDALSNFDPTDPATLASGMIQVAGAAGVSQSVNIKTQYGDFQPRLGFAATLGHGMVLRGGFGISYWTNNVGSAAALRNAPLVATSTINQTATPTYTISQSAPAIVANSVCLAASCGASTSSPGYSPSGFSVSDSTQVDYHYTKVYMSNLTLEKELWGNVLSVGFIGLPVRNLGHPIPNIATNLPPLGPGGCGVTTTVTFGSPCLPYHDTLPLVGTITLLKTDGFSNYTALQIIFRRRTSHGLTIDSNYTYSQDLADVYGPQGTCVTCGQVWNNDARDYGQSDYKVKHRAVFTADYQLPFGKNLNGAAGFLGKGWELNGIWAYATGQPFTVVDGSAQQNSFGITSDRPNWVPGQGFKRSVNEWFDVTQFAKQTFGTAGNEGRNVFTMPSNTRIDFSIFKNIPIPREWTLQFRAEGFNVLNHPAFGMPNTTISGFSSSGVPTNAGNFGAITSTNTAYTPRDIQFALKLLF